MTFVHVWGQKAVHIVGMTQADDAPLKTLCGRLNWPQPEVGPRRSRSGRMLNALTLTQGPATCQSCRRLHLLHARKGDA